MHDALRRKMLSNNVAGAFAPTLDLHFDAFQNAPNIFTYTRATTATVKDFEGLIKNCLSGELRIQGARRVRNLVTVKSENGVMASGGAPVVSLVSYGGKTGVNSLEFSSGATVGTAAHTYASYPAAVVAGVSYRASFLIALSRPLTGSEQIRVRVDGDRNWANSGVTFSAASQVGATLTRYTGAVGSTSGSGNVGLYVDVQGASLGADLTVYFTEWQIEEVTGQSNKNPSEYVSVGVTSSPTYHGYFVDGVKYFSYQNGNTVASNVVTEAQGAAITGTIGYLAEGARTNLCLQSNSLTTTWTQVGTPATTQNAVGADGAISAWTLTDNSAVASEGIQQANNLTAVTYTASVLVKKTTGAQASYPVFLIGTATPLEALMTIDTSNGVATVWTAHTGATITTSSARCSSFNDDYWLAELTFLATADTWYSSFYCAGTTNATQSTGDLDVAAQGSAVICELQLEIGAFASTRIRTTTAAVARNADVLTFPIAGIMNNTQGGAYAKCTQNWTGILSAYAGIIGDRAMYIQSSGNKLSMYDGTTENDTKTITLSSTSAQKFMTTWGGSSMRQFAGGSGGTATAFDGDLGMGATMQIGSSTFNGVIESVKCWMSKPSDASAQGITA